MEECHAFQLSSYLAPTPLPPYSFRNGNSTVPPFLSTGGQSILISVVFTPSPPRSQHGKCLPPTSHLFTNTALYRRCGLAYPYDWRGFEDQKEDERGPLSIQSMPTLASREGAG